MGFSKQGELLDPFTSAGSDTHRPGEGVGTAGGGPIFVNPASICRHKGTQTLLSDGFEGNDGQSAARTGAFDGIGAQEGVGGKIQTLFQAQDVVGGQVLVQIPAALIETGHRGVAGETEGLIDF
jgi:hypothetical protein